MGDRRRSLYLLNAEGEPTTRNLVSIEGLILAVLKDIDHPKVFQQLNCSAPVWDQLIDYRRIAEYLKQRRGLQSVGIQIEYHRIWLDNTKAKFLRD